MMGHLICPGFHYGTPYERRVLRLTQTTATLDATDRLVRARSNGIRRSIFLVPNQRRPQISLPKVSTVPGSALQFAEHFLLLEIDRGRRALHPSMGFLFTVLHGEPVA